MKNSRFLFLILLLGLLGLVSWWWKQRYTTESNHLKDVIVSLETQRRNKRLEDAFSKLDEVFKANALPLENTNKDGDTIITMLDFSEMDASKSIVLSNDENDEPQLEMIAPKWMDSTYLDTTRNSRYTLSTSLGLGKKNKEDTVVKIKFDFRELSNTNEERQRYFTELGDSLGVKLKYLDGRSNPIAEQDTMGQWYWATTSRNSFRFGSDSKIQQSTFLLVEQYRPYLLTQIWPELLAGLSLLFGMLGFYGLVRRDFKRQEHELEEKDRFIANVAHELKTPIATVGVALEALQNFGADADPERRQNYTQIARQELERLELLSDRALRTIQLDAGSLAIQREAVNLRELVEKSWSALALKYALPTNQLCYFDNPIEKEVGLQSSQPNESSQPLSISTTNTLVGDRELLLHLVYNLLDNACKYGGNPPKIEVKIRQEPKEMVLEISDNGPGIPPGERLKIFTKFYRIDSGKGHLVKGHGLGLSYTKQIVEAHGGSIRVTDTPMGGSTFVVRLPSNKNA